MAGKKIFISYVTLVIYIVCVFLLSLLLALLLSLVGVNRKACKDQNGRACDVARDLEAEVQQPVFAENVEVKPELRQKRSNDKAHEKFYNRIDELKKYSNLHPSYNQLKEVDSCPELFEYEQNGTLWESFRLPKNVKPSRYELEFYRPIFPQKIYNGEVAISVDLSEDTDTFILHAHYLNVIYPSIYDKDENELDLKCADYYPLYEYFVIRTKEKVSKDIGPLKIMLYFNGFLDEYESGLFLVDYRSGTSGASDFNGNLMVSHFQPLDARKAFPCFDEPEFKAVFSLRVNHPNYTIAASNMPVDNAQPTPGRNSTTRTVFQDTPRIPTFALALVVFNQNDFKQVEGTSINGLKINVWALNRHINGGFADGPRDLAVDIYNAVEYYLEPFLNASDSSWPSKIDLVALPNYPDDAVSHWGIPIFKETKLLFKGDSVTETVKQRIALLISKQFAEFWFGNSVTFKWWDELWLQEGLGDYLKYKFVDFAYQEWRVNEQFITEELINVLVDDTLPSSHPVIKPIYYFFDIEQLFDDVETTKVAAVMRMVEYGIGEFAMWRALSDYLLNFEFGTGDPQYLYESIGNVRKWPAKDFFERWFLQANYPLIDVRINYDAVSNSSSFVVKQSRNVNGYNVVFDPVDLYPNPFNFTWYVPVTCVFGFDANTTEPDPIEFDIDQPEETFDLPENFKWVHCNEFFTGYYTLDYSLGNWRYLADLLRAGNSYFEPPERANIIHNIFQNAYADKERYYDLVGILSYLRRERDYLPWKTVSKHVNDMLDIIQYRPSFFEVSTWFNFELRLTEHNENLWEVTTNHLEQLTKSTILDLACKVQDFECLTNTSIYWEDVYNYLTDSFTPNTVPVHARPVVYNYHFQNTYHYSDWDYAFIKYESTDDTQEQERFLEALTYSRLPSQLAKFLNSQRSGGLQLVDFVDAVKYFAQNPLGRELIWNYYRSNYEDLIEEYSVESPILGTLLLEIVSTFEDEYLFYELVKFVLFSPSGASLNARFKALEKVAINIAWILENEDELEHAFGLGGFKQADKQRHRFIPGLKSEKNKYQMKDEDRSKTADEFIAKAKAYLDKSDEFKLLKEKFMKGRR